MYSKLINMTICLVLFLLATPAFSHLGHTSVPHTHGGIEILLISFAIAVIVYRIIKK